MEATTGYKRRPNLVYSKRSTFILTEGELEQLKAFIESDEAPYATINKNTRVHRLTVVSLLKNGSASMPVISKIRAFLAALKETDLQHGSVNNIRQDN